jgi:mono/diheme cytochrome c family protein
MRIILTTLALAVIASTAASAADAKAGQAIYEKSCKSCHGPDGAGNPSVAKMMKVDMKSLSSAEVQGMSDGDLKKIVTEGKGKMKAQTITGSVDDVVAYVRSLKK